MYNSIINLKKATKKENASNYVILGKPLKVFKHWEMQLIKKYYYTGNNKSEGFKSQRP